MLIVVEDGNVAAFLQLLLNLKAAGGCNVFQIDSAKGAGEQGDGVDDFVNILAAHAEGDCVYAAKGLEEEALAFHDRHAGFGADVAKAEDGSAVGNNGDRVPAACQIIAFVYVFLDFKAGCGNTRRIGQRKGFIAVHCDTGRNFNFAFELCMQCQRLCGVIHCMYPSGIGGSCSGIHLDKMRTCEGTGKTCLRPKAHYAIHAEIATIASMKDSYGTGHAGLSQGELVLLCDGASVLL